MKTFAKLLLCFAPCAAASALSAGVPPLVGLGGECAEGVAAPRLTPSGPAAVGERFSLTLETATALTPFFVSASLDSTHFIAGDCDLWLGSEVAATFGGITAGDGSASLTASIDRGLVGLTFVVQGFVIDPTSKFGAALTDAWSIVVQP